MYNHNWITGKCNAPKDWHIYIPGLKGNKCEIYLRLMIKTKIKDGHFLWFGSVGSSGYGRLTLGNKGYSICKLSLFLEGKLKLSDSLQALHVDELCRFRNCWNPDHLYAGTQSDNIRDSVIAGNHFWIKNERKGKTHCDCGRLLDPDRSYNNTRCKKCQKLHVKSYNKKYYIRIKKEKIRDTRS